MRVELYRESTVSPIWVTYLGWRWRVIARNNRIAAASSEAYVRRIDAVRNLEMVTGRQLLDAELVAVGGDVWPVRVIL